MGRPKGSRNKPKSVPRLYDLADAVEDALAKPKKRGRPIGWRKVKATEPVIGKGSKRYQFPIVRNGNVRKHMLMLSVNAESFAEALATAVIWAVEYSQKLQDESDDLTLEFWPLVRYQAIGGMTKGYVRRIDVNFAYVEGKDWGFWLHTLLLKEVA